MAIVANRYLEAGGVMVEVFNTLYLLEEVYPLDIVKETTVELHNYGTGYYDKLCYYTLWYPQSVLCLLKDRQDWLKEWDPSCHFGPYYKYDVCFDSHVSFTLAHEWGHLIQREGSEFDGVNIPKDYCLMTYDFKADILACSFVDNHMEHIMDLNKEPRIFQCCLDSLGGQLALGFDTTSC